MQLKKTGLVVTTVLLAAPLMWMVPLAATHPNTAMFSQYLGVFALIKVAITQILTTRMKFVEPIFGGLDRVYVLHK